MDEAGKLIGLLQREPRRFAQVLDRVAEFAHEQVRHNPAVAEVFRNLAIDLGSAAQVAQTLDVDRN